jgi:hypothetical protein
MTKNLAFGLSFDLNEEGFFDKIVVFHTLFNNKDFVSFMTLYDARTIYKTMALSPPQISDSKATVFYLQLNGFQNFGSSQI